MDPQQVNPQQADVHDDGVNRRGFLKCMAWAGTGLVWAMSGGIPASQAFGKNVHPKSGDLTFVQISDSHMGFNKPANTDVIGTLKTAIDQINGLATPAEFLLHTGDISHLSRPEKVRQRRSDLKKLQGQRSFLRSRRTRSSGRGRRKV